MNVWRRDVKLSNLMGEKPTKLSDPLQYWNIWLPTECEDVLSDREFKTLAGEKGRIISGRMIGMGMGLEGRAMRARLHHTSRQPVVSPLSPSP